MQNRHMHADVIKAWANGEIIEYRPKNNVLWSVVTSPQPPWRATTEYRVRPKCRRCNQEIVTAWANGAPIEKLMSDGINWHRLDPDVCPSLSDGTYRVAECLPESNVVYYRRYIQLDKTRNDGVVRAHIKGLPLPDFDGYIIWVDTTYWEGTRELNPA